MEYIITRNFELPIEKKEMEQSEWFNLWNRRFFPYRELLVGDTVYWFDRTKQRLLWKTKVVKINRFPFHRKKEILDRYPECATSQYFKEGRDTGYFIFYRVSVTEMLDTDALLDFGSRRSAGSASTMKQLKTGSVARKTRIRRR